MKNYVNLFAAILFSGLFLISCDPSNDENSAESVGIAIQESNVLKGKKMINKHQISYEVTEISDAVFTAKISVDQYTLSTSVDYTSENISLDGDKAVLSNDQKESLLILGDELSAYIFKDGSVNDFTMIEYTLLRLLEYSAKSPNGYSYQKIEIKGNLINGIKGSNEGVTCIRKNTYVTAVYDDASGRQYRDRKLVNGNRCLGRCGSGCPGIFTIASAWTKDCLDHDQCGRVLGGSTNPFDSDCGDEYAQAADDYLFGVIRGCRG